MGGLTLAEIAAFEKISEDEVKQVIEQAKTKLRQSCGVKFLGL